MISDDVLRQAARDWETARLEQSPKPEECCFTASFRFRRSMKRTLRRTDHPVRCQIRRIAACFLLAVLLGGGGMLTISKDARAAFAGWTKRAFGNCVEYTYTGQNMSAPQVVYCPTWIPDGFSLVTEFERHTGTNFYYVNEEGQYLSFDYTAYNEGFLLQIEGENYLEVLHTKIGKCPADLYIDDSEYSVLVWTDDEKKLLFEIFAPLSEDDMIKMAESVAAQ